MAVQSPIRLLTALIELSVEVDHVNRDKASKEVILVALEDRYGTSACRRCSIAQAAV